MSLSLQERLAGVLAPREEEKLPRTSLPPQRRHSPQQTQAAVKTSAQGRQEALLKSLTTPLPSYFRDSFCGVVEGAGT